MASLFSRLKCLKMWPISAERKEKKKKKKRTITERTLISSGDSRISSCDGPFPSDSEERVRVGHGIEEMRFERGNKLCHIAVFSSYGGGRGSASLHLLCSH